MRYSRRGPPSAGCSRSKCRAHMHAWLQASTIEDFLSQPDGLRRGGRRTMHRLLPDAMPRLWHTTLECVYAARGAPISDCSPPRVRARSVLPLLSCTCASYADHPLVLGAQLLGQELRRHGQIPGAIRRHVLRSQHHATVGPDHPGSTHSCVKAHDWHMRTCTLMCTNN